VKALKASLFNRPEKSDLQVQLLQSPIDFQTELISKPMTPALMSTSLKSLPIEELHR
jgi:hypothetical protein